MGWFSITKQQAFMTTAEGQRLFWAGWSRRPYIIPDQETEQRLMKKLMLLSRIILFVPIVGSQIWLRTTPDFFHIKVFPFLIYLGVVLAFDLITRNIIFRDELQKLSRAPSRPPKHDVQLHVAGRYSVEALVFYVLMGCSVVAGGIWMLTEDFSKSLAWFAICFFSWATLGCAKMLFVKLANE